MIIPTAAQPDTVLVTQAREDELVFLHSFGSAPHNMLWLNYHSSFTNQHNQSNDYVPYDISFLSCFQTVSENANVHRCCLWTFYPVSHPGKMSE